MRKGIRFWQVAVAAAAVLAIATGCSGGDKSGGGGAAFGDAVAGKKIYMDTCAACHGADGKGITGVGKDLVTRSEWMKKQNDEALLAFMKQGRMATDPENTTKIDMPPKGGNPALNDEHLKDVIAYMRSIQK